MTKTFLKQNILLVSLYAIFLCVMAYVFAYTSKNEIHVQINQMVGNPLLDRFFFYITYIGDGILGALFVLIALLINVRLGIYVAISLILSAINTNFLKYQVFDEHVRPYFIYQYQLRYQPKTVEGVELMILKSFPSGHATQSFAIFFAFALAAKKQPIKLLFLLIALMGAFSRVYLSQHWLQDITAGSVIGVFYALLAYLAFYNRPVWQKLNKPLATFFKA